VLAEQREVLQHALKRLVVDDDTVVIFGDAVEIGRHASVDTKVRLPPLVLDRIAQLDPRAVVLDPLLDRLSWQVPDDVVGQVLINEMGSVQATQLFCLHLA
jgi:hypothetical protein